MTRRLVGLATVLGLFLALSAYGAGALLRVHQMRGQIETTERDLATLRAQAERLSQMVERLRNDPLSVEKLAREDLGMVRQGETILKFPSEKR